MSHRLGEHAGVQLSGTDNLLRKETERGLWNTGTVEEAKEPVSDYKTKPGKEGSECLLQGCLSSNFFDSCKINLVS